MSSPRTEPLRAEWIALLRAVRARVGQPDNDYGWTTWADGSAAQAEIDRLLGPLQAGSPLDRAALTLLFAPTAALQELAMSSGWVEEYLRWATEADRLLAAADGGAS